MNLTGAEGCFGCAGGKITEGTEAKSESECRCKQGQAGCVGSINKLSLSLVGNLMFLGDFACGMGILESAAYIGMVPFSTYFLEQ